jgi:hypothetical protein
MGLSKNKVKNQKLLFLHQELIYGAVVKPFAPRIKKPANDFRFNMSKWEAVATNFKEMVFVLLRLELV